PLDINTGELQLGTAEQWIYSCFAETLTEVTKGMDNYRFDLASQAMYEFTWDQYCDWYVELSKTTLNSETSSDAEKRGTLHTLINILEGMLRMMHPLMPFITEELWQKIVPMLNKDNQTIMLTQYPHEQDYEKNTEATVAIEWVKQFILGVRRIRAERDISPGKKLSVKITGGNDQEQNWLKNNESYIKTFGKVQSIEAVEETPADAVMAIAGDMTILVPLADIINPADELTRITKELGKVSTEIEKLSTKLANKGFTERAPEVVVNKEREKLADFESSLTKLHSYPSIGTRQGADHLLLPVLPPRIFSASISLIPHSIGLRD
ncbi:MAG: class I tRNA ligase family protein, partial [Pseudomonadota bacterium]